MVEQELARFIADSTGQVDRLTIAQRPKQRRRLTHQVRPSITQAVCHIRLQEHVLGFLWAKTAMAVVGLAYVVPFQALGVAQ